MSVVRPLFTESGCATGSNAGAEPLIVTTNEASETLAAFIGREKTATSSPVRLMSVAPSGGHVVSSVGSVGSVAPVENSATTRSEGCVMT